ncbi:MAG: oligosaccharide flippase family protein [Parasphingorhabdus sp.]|nr:oligosaccharide flippase family protein [Parasphingorhabdus sp.]
MSSQYAAFIIQFITSVIISRYFLLPAEVGLFSIGLAAAMLVSILQDFGLTRYISGKKDLDEAHIRVCSSISFAFVFVVILIIAALAWPMAIFYGEPRLFAMMLVIAASFLFVPFSITPTALLMRDMHFRPIFFVNVGGAVANGATALLLAWQGFSANRFMGINRSRKSVAPL